MRTDSMEEQLIEIWSEVLQCDQVSPQDDFFRLGGGSIEVAQVVVAIEKRWGVRCPMSVFLSAPTIEALGRIVAERGSRAWSTLVPLQPHGALPPFFCVHGVGGSVFSFQHLFTHFDRDQPFYGIRAVGSFGDDEPLTCIEDMASRYLQEIRIVQPKGPYYLGGYSFGDSVALEMAQQLRAEGEKVAFLAIIDHTPPPTRYRRFTWTPALPFAFAVNAVRWVMEDLYRVGPRGWVPALRLNLVKLMKQLSNVLPQSTPRSGKTDVQELFSEPRIPDQFRRLLETHYQAMREYHPKPYPGRVTLFRARTRPLFRLHGNDLGWRKLAAGSLDVITVPGNHESMLEEPNVSVLAQSLLTHLQLARGERQLVQAWGSAPRPYVSANELSRCVQS
jgi:thioesterase domain-containing protein/acyl carrier protein